MGFKFKTPVVLSFGEESFFLDRDIIRFRDQPEACVTYLDGSEVSEYEVVSLCETFQIDFEDPTNIKPRVIVVNNGNKLKAGKPLKEYIDSRDAQDTSAVLAIVARSEKCPVFWTKFGTKIVIREHKKLKTWDNNNEVVKWVLDESKQLGLKLTEALASLMFQVIGPDLYVLSSELRKLKLLVGKDPVTLESLQSVITPASNLASWDAADAVFLKNPKRAMNIVSALYRFEVEDPSLSILGSLMKSAERLFVARSMLDKGVQSDEIASRLGYHPYRYQKSLQPQVALQTVKGLAKVMLKLSKLDVELKRTSHRRTLVELAILEFASI